MKFARDWTKTGGVGDPDHADLDRRAQDVVKFGRVKEVDYEKDPPVYRIAFGDEKDEDNYILTDWIPASGARASEDGDTETHFLEVGEKVVMFAEGGELASAQVMPASTYTEKNKPATRQPGVWRREFKNGAVVGYDRKTGELVLDATKDKGKVTVRGKDAVLRMSNGKTTIQTGSKAEKTGLKTKRASAGEKGGDEAQAGEEQKFDLNQQMKGIHARVEQLEHTASAQHFATSLLHNLLLPTNPQIMSLLSIFNATPGSMEQMIQRVTGMLPGYANSLLKLAMGKFQVPTLDSIGGMFQAYLDGALNELQGMVTSAIAEQAGVVGQIADLTRQIEAGGDPEQIAGLIAQRTGLQNNPIFQTLGDLQARLSSLQNSMPAAPDFMDSQKNITKGMIESVRFGGLGKAD